MKEPHFPAQLPSSAPPRHFPTGRNGRRGPRLAGCALLFSIFLLILLPGRTLAQAEDGGGRGNSVARMRSTVVTTPVATPTPSATAPPAGTPPPPVIQQILHLFVFNDSTMSEAITRSLLRMFGGMLYDSIDTFNDVIHQTLTFLDITGFPGNTAPGDGTPGPSGASGIGKLEALRFEGWQTMLAIAGVLLPLSLALTIGAAMRESAVSITGYASAREALLEWLISIGEAGGSWFFIQISLQLSHYAASAILSAFRLNLLEDPFLLRDLITGGISKGEVFSMGTPLLLQLFVALFAILMVGAVALSLTLAIFARYVLLFLITVTAPVMFVLGALRPLRWLSSFWSKAMVVVILLGPINVLLLSVGSRLQTIAFEQSTGLVGTILALLTLIGVLSVLLSTNGAIGKLVYGAAIDTARQALHATGEVLTLAFTVAGIAAGAGLTGSGGGAATGAALGGGIPPAGGPSPSTPPGGGGMGGGTAFAGGGGWRDRGAQGFFPRTTSSGALAGELGQILSSVDTPLTRGLGTGLRLASQAARVRSRMGSAPPTGGAEALDTGQEALDRPVDLGAGIPGEAEARSALEHTVADSSRLLSERGMGRAQAKATLSQGVALGTNAVAAAQSHLGIAAPRLFHDLGFAGEGVTLEQSGSQFLQSAAQAYAFGDPLPWLLHPGLNARGTSTGVSAQDVGAALEILTHRPEARLSSPAGIGTLATLSHQLRAEGVYPTAHAVAQSAIAYGRGDLIGWMEGATGQLRQPPSGLAERIGALRASDGEGEAPPSNDPQGGVHEP